MFMLPAVVLNLTNVIVTLIIAIVVAPNVNEITVCPLTRHCTAPCITPLLVSTKKVARNALPFALRAFAGTVRTAPTVTEDIEVSPVLLFVASIPLTLIVRAATSGKA